MKIAFSDKGADGCIFDEDADIPGDTGSYVVKPKGTLDSTGPNDDPEDLRRHRHVVAHDARARPTRQLDGESKFTLKQVRSFTFTSAP